MTFLLSKYMLFFPHRDFFTQIIYQLQVECATNNFLAFNYYLFWKKENETSLSSLSAVIQNAEPKLPGEKEVVETVTHCFSIMRWVFYLHNNNKNIRHSSIKQFTFPSQNYCPTHYSYVLIKQNILENKYLRKLRVTEL